MGKFSALIEKSAKEDKALALKKAIPAGWNADDLKALNRDGKVVSGSITANDVLHAGVALTHSNILAAHGLPADEYEIIDGSVEKKSWDCTIKNADNEPETVTNHGLRFKFKLIDLVAAAEANETLARIEKIFSKRYAANRAALKKAAKFTDDVLLICFADLQLGKTDKLGGTPETLRRVRDIFSQLIDDLRAGGVKYNRVVFADLGDIIEGFSNTGAQLFTNDLSLPDQIDTVINLVVELIHEVQPYANKFVYVAVPSNHSRWSIGKALLGRPEDDYGILIAKQAVARLTAAGVAIELVTPESWEEHILLNINGNEVGFVHGSQYGMNAGYTWLAKQSVGRTGMYNADFFFTGHYHSYSNRNEGRPWIQCPTLDNGSQWWTNKSGMNSEPGMVVAVIPANAKFRNGRDVRVYGSRTDGSDSLAVAA